MPRWDTLFTDVRLATLAPGSEPYGAIHDAALALQDGRIAWLGPAAQLPATDTKEHRSLDGRWITPALIDQLGPKRSGFVERTKVRKGLTQGLAIDRRAVDQAADTLGCLGGLERFSNRDRVGARGLLKCGRTGKEAPAAELRTWALPKFCAELWLSLRLSRDRQSIEVLPVSCPRGTHGRGHYKCRTRPLEALFYESV